MNENIVVIYGSGASYGSGYKIKINNLNSLKNPPTDIDFFNYIKDDFLFYNNYKALFIFKKLYFDSNYIPGMEEVWTALDLNYKHITLDTYNWFVESLIYTPFGHEKYQLLSDAGIDFKKLIYDIYSNYKEPKDIDNFKSLHNIITKSNLNFLGYITFNYDCFLENSLKDFDFKYIGFNYDTKSIDKLIHNNFPIIKLHGSLNWEHKIENGYRRPITFHAPPYSKSKQIKPKYNTNDSWCEPAIIPPTLFKQEINDDSRSEDFLTQTILQQWRAAITLLRETDKIIFVGYSFPISDFHVKRIFQIARMPQSDEDIKNIIRNKDIKKKDIKILYCTGKNDDKNKKKDLLKSVFGKNTKIIVIKEFSNLLSSDELIKFLD